MPKPIRVSSSQQEQQQEHPKSVNQERNDEFAPLVSIQEGDDELTRKVAAQALMALKLKQNADDLLKIMELLKSNSTSSSESRLRFRAVDALGRSVAQRQDLIRENKVDIVQLVLHGMEPNSSVQKIDPTFMTETLLPYLAALEKVQQVIDHAKGKEPRPTQIFAITQYSPVKVSILGVKETGEFVQNVLDPRKRDHIDYMNFLEERKQQAEIDKVNAEILESKSRAAKDEAEKEKLLAEAAKTRAEAKELETCNQVVEMKLKTERVKLAIQLVHSANSGMSEIEIKMLAELLDEPLKTILLTPLTLAVE